MVFGKMQIFIHADSLSIVWQSYTIESRVDSKLTKFVYDDVGLATSCTDGWRTCSRGETTSWNLRDSTPTTTNSWDPISSDHSPVGFDTNTPLGFVEFNPGRGPARSRKSMTIIFATHYQDPEDFETLTGSGISGVTEESLDSRKCHYSPCLRDSRGFFNCQKSRQEAAIRRILKRRTFSNEIPERERRIDAKASAFALRFAYRNTMFFFFLIYFAIILKLGRL